MAFKLTKRERAEGQKLFDAFDTAASELSQWLADLAEDWNGQFDEKSEKWQEGEAGEAARAKIDIIEAWIDAMPSDGLDGSLDDLE